LAKIFPDRRPEKLDLNTSLPQRPDVNEVMQIPNVGQGCSGGRMGTGRAGPMIFGISMIRAA
jgi:hypothetical protein